LDDAVEKIEAWRIEYNQYRPHSSLNDFTPAEFIEQMQKEKEIKKALQGAPSPPNCIRKIIRSAAGQ